MELQKNLKHFKFWKYFYWKHDKATLRSWGYQDSLYLDNVLYAMNFS